MHKWILLLIIVIVSVSVGSAQDVVEPQLVELQTDDDLTLVGDFYALGEEEAPTVLLLHMLGQRRSSWEALIQPLLDAGYQVLAVDLRGHGDTGGSQDWEAAQNDTQLWLAWLREQPNVRDNAVSIMGASVGSSLALVGCAADELCMTAILLSPVDFQIIEEDDALEPMEAHSMLLVTGDSDRESMTRLRDIITLVRGDVGTRIYDSGLHGTNLFIDEEVNVSLTTLIISWLDEHIPQVEAE